MRTGRIGRFGVTAVALAGACELSGCVVSHTGSASLVADRSVRLSGNLVSDRDASNATYWFEYGPTTGYGAETTHTTVGVSRGVGQDVSDSVDGLTAATLYHYRLCSDLPDDGVPASCGSDQLVSTSTGRGSVRGQGSYSSTVFDPLNGNLTVSRGIGIVATGDDATGGNVEGTAGAGGTFYSLSQHAVFPYSYDGTVVCVRVAGNLAVAGISFSNTFPGGSSSELLVIEDNGPAPGADRWTENVDAWSPQQPCPAPSTSLFGVGAHQGGDFVVQGS